MPIVLRSSKNGALTFAEMDGNFTDLNTRISSKVDSANVLQIIDTTYINSIVDSSYVQSRQSMAGNYQNSNVDAHLNVSTASNGDVLKWNGSDYIWDSDVSNDLSSVSVTTMGASAGGFLSYDSSTGVFTFRPADLSGYVQIGSETSTLNDVVQRGHTTTTTAVIPFLYSNQAAFPSATTYHGAIAHSHADGAMYFAHAGAWHKLANDSDLNGDMTGSVFADDSTLLVDGTNGTINSSALTMPIQIPDGAISSNYIGFGDDDDLKIFHNGSSSIITETNLTSSLILRSYQDVRLADAGGTETMLKAISHGAVELYHNNVKKLETTADGVKLGDDGKATFGDDNDLEIYHTGGVNYIAGAGSTILTGNWLYLSKPGSTEHYLIGKAEGAVELYYDNVKKFETSASGIKIEAGVEEKFATTNAATGVTALDCATGHVHYLTSPAGDVTANFTNLNLTAEYATNVTIIINQGATPYEVTAVQIGGAAQTINWQGGSAPTGTANGIDAFSFTILNNGGSYVVLGQMVDFT